MLLSPGHSPRHLSSPSPSSNSESTLQISSNSSSINNTPLRDRLEWLEAMKSGDPIQIRDAQLKIMERRGKKVNNPNSDGSIRSRNRTQTPGSTFMRNLTPFDEFDSISQIPSVVMDRGLSSNAESSENEVAVDKNLSLDDFFRRYTSEDNDSFSKILEKVNRKRKERYGHLLEGEKEDVKLIGDAKRDRITDGYGTSDQPPSTLEGWNYTAKNLLMYHPADRGEAPLTEEEQALRLKGLTKEINRPNTRFHGKMLDTRPRDDGVVEVLYTPVVGATPLPMYDRDGDKAKKYDLEDLRRTPDRFYAEGKKADNGYSFVRTPSPAPGADESPFITWGEIEGTPMRLEPEDTPIDIGGSGDGPHFKIPNPPARDVKAHSLSREASRRKFVRNAISRSSSSVDETLRATYRGASPGVGTPKSGRSISRFGRDGSMSSRSPSVRDNANPPW
ncbi:hypothetical protein OIU78_011221 [Salix suchowensis]|nr:hypothetical protein OIU78_011221 [Salix suchowensis]